MVPLTPAQVEALDALQGIWPESDFLLVGALALGCHIDLSYRHTSDMDLAVGIDGDILETQTHINLQILERFGERSLDMAFPTQTIYQKAVA